MMIVIIVAAVHDKCHSSIRKVTQVLEKNVFVNFHYLRFHRLTENNYCLCNQTFLFTKNTPMCLF